MVPAASCWRSRSRRPLTLPSMRRSPTRTMSPPRRSTSVSVSSAIRPPVICSSRAVRARTSRSVSAVARCRAWPSAVALLRGGRRRTGLLEELLDEAALPLVGHRLADDAAGRPKGEIRDLGPEVGDRPLLLRLEIGAGPDADPLELL